MTTARPRSGRLFWKLLATTLGGMMASMACVVGYLQLIGHRPPPPDPDMPMLLGIVPLFPLLPIVISTLAMLVASLGLAWYLSRPLNHLSWALRQIAEGHLETRVLSRMGRRSDEIVDLAVDFDRMAAQFQALTQSREELLHDVSHELRSPLARLQVAIGLLRQDPASPQSASMLERIERESQRLDDLIEALLTWHRLEAGAATPPPARVDVLELLHAIADDAQFEAHAQGKEVRIEAPGSFVAQVQGELIYRAFENVIRNAIKYTREGGAVVVTAQVVHAAHVGEALVCRVDDHGPGVPEDMLETIFQPFMRVKGSEGVHGVGLGLAIAQRALALHGGSIRAALRPEGGLSVTLMLPRPGPVFT